MSEKEYRSFLIIKVGHLLAYLMEKEKLPFLEALQILYSSTMYKKLEDEHLKLWHLSTPMLYETLKYERKHHRFKMPEYL